MARAEKVETDEIETETPERSIREELEAAANEVHERESADQPPRDDARPKDDGKDAQASASRGGAPDRSAVQKPQSDADRVPQQRDRGGQAATPNAPAVADQPPQYWNTAVKPLWSNLPPEVRAEVNRRETEVHKRLTQYDEVRNIGSEFTRAANEFAPLIQARGGNPIGLFREVMGHLNRIQNSDPATRAAIFRQLAAANGADLGQPAAPGAPQPGQQNTPIVHPAVAQMAREWQEFKQRQESYQRSQQEAERQRQATLEAECTSEIEAFRADPSHQYFDSVKDLMASMLNSGVAENLDKAYEMAVRAHPQAFSALQAAEAAKRQADEAKRLKAEAAKRKAGSVRGGPGGSQPRAPGSSGSVADDLRAAFEEARARV